MKPFLENDKMNINDYLTKCQWEFKCYSYKEFKILTKKCEELGLEWFQHGIVSKTCPFEYEPYCGFGFDLVALYQNNMSNRDSYIDEYVERCIGLKSKRTIFEFRLELDSYLRYYSFTFEDIKAIDVKISKQESINGKSITKDYIFQLPPNHKYDEKVKVVDAIDKESRKPLHIETGYGDFIEDFTFNISGTIWLNNGNWFLIKPKRNFTILDYNSVPVFDENILECTIKEVEKDEYI